MKILYHHRTQGKGVEGVHIQEMVNAWRYLGHSVDIASPYGISGQEEPAKKASGLKRNLFKQISKRLPEIIFELLEIAYNLPASANFSRRLKENAYDMIYERYALLNWSGVKTARKSGVPIILEVNYTAHTPLFRKRNKLLTKLAIWIDQYLFREADGIVVVSSYLKDHLIDTYGVSEEKIIVLPNAADPDVFSPAIDSGPVRTSIGAGQKKVIGFAGGFYPWHGLEILFNVFQDITERVEDAVLLLIGNGPMKSQLMEMASKNGYEHRVIFIDSVEHKALPEYIAAFDVAVLPDSNLYGSPMKVFEYMSMGMPVVAPRLGPLTDVITDGKEGLLFEPKNAGELSGALVSLLNDNQLRARMGQAARETILCRHNWKKNASSVLELYKRFNKVNIGADATGKRISSQC